VRLHNTKKSIAAPKNKREREKKNPVRERHGRYKGMILKRRVEIHIRAAVRGRTKRKECAYYRRVGEAIQMESRSSDGK